MRPVEPPPTRWRLPEPELADEDGIVAIGGDLEPGTLLAAYRRGLFPMPYGRRRVAWFSPDPRAIIPLDGLRVSRSLRRSSRRFEVRRDTRFAEVMVRCADPRRPGGWITPTFVRAYDRLHRLGWAHSFECYDDDGELVGGLYGVRIAGFFAGESMFHTARDGVQGGPGRPRGVAARHRGDAARRPVADRAPHHRWARSRSAGRSTSTCSARAVASGRTGVRGSTLRP